jgi:hypothetical protein
MLEKALDAHPLGKSVGGMNQIDRLIVEVIQVITSAPVRK